MPIERHQASGLYPPLPLPSFDESGRPRRTPSPLAPSVDAHDSAEPRLPSARDVAQIIETARQEGYDEGYRTGYAEGKAEGYQAGFTAGHAEGYTQGEREGRQAGEAQGHADGFAAGQREGVEQAKAEWGPRWAEQCDALNRLVSEIATAWQQMPQKLAEPIATLAIEIARSVLQEELKTHPETVVALAQKMLASETRRPVTVKLHPDDLTLVRDAVGEPEGVRWQADPELTRGSVWMEGESFLVDATLPNRWRRLVSRINPAAATWAIGDDEPR